MSDRFVPARKPFEVYVQANANYAPIAFREEVNHVLYYSLDSAKVWMGQHIYRDISLPNAANVLFSRSYRFLRDHKTLLRPRHVLFSHSYVTYHLLDPYVGRDPKNPMRIILSAAIAGALGGIAGNPADIILVRMTTDSLRKPENRYSYRNGLDGLIRLVKEEGVAGLKRGLGPNTVRVSLKAFIILPTSCLFSQIRAVLMNVRVFLMMVDSLIPAHLPCSSRRAPN